MEEWIKISDAAQKLGISEITLRRRIKKGSIPYKFEEGKYIVPVHFLAGEQVKDAISQKEKIESNISKLSSQNLTSQDTSIQKTIKKTSSLKTPAPTKAYHSRHKSYHDYERQTPVNHFSSTLSSNTNETYQEPSYSRDQLSIELAKNAEKDIIIKDLQRRILDQKILISYYEEKLHSFLAS